MPRIKRAKAASRAVGPLGGRPRTIPSASAILSEAISVQEDPTSPPAQDGLNEVRESVLGMACLVNFVKLYTKN